MLLYAPRPCPTAHDLVAVLNPTPGSLSRREHSRKPMLIEVQASRSVLSKATVGTFGPAEPASKPCLKSGRGVSSTTNSRRDFWTTHTAHWSSKCTRVGSCRLLGSDASSRCWYDRRQSRAVASNWVPSDTPGQADLLFRAVSLTALLVHSRVLCFVLQPRGESETPCKILEQGSK